MLANLIDFQFIQFVLVALITIIVIFANKEALSRIQNILDILNNGAYKNCPFYKDRQIDGRRWYDKNTKGGENL